MRKQEGWLGMKLRSSYLVMAFAVLAVAPMSVFAQAAADGLTIGVVNVGRLLKEAPQAQDAREALEDEFAPRRREIVALQAEFEKKGATMQKDLEVMGAEERENAQRDLRNDERAILRAQNEFREDLDLRNNEAIGAIQQEVLREIAAYGDSQGLDIILADGIVYASDKVDITEAVLARLRGSYKGSRSVIE
ncbi:MAG: OmpH family outer membrane protein [Gammaproteobacteria bacterium]|nr:MAG: OmpH family outer membrane protein [Gammaproteobacteria bacterium]